MLPALDYVGGLEVDAADLEGSWASGEAMARLAEPATAGRGGALLLERVPRGDWLVLVHHPDYRLELGALRPEDPAARVALHRGGMVLGRVTEPGGRPLAGARVLAVSRSALDAAEGRAQAGKALQEVYRKLAIALHPDLDYVAVARGGEALIVARGLLADAARRLGWGAEPEVIARFTGAELVGAGDVWIGPGAPVERPYPAPAGPASGPGLLLLGDHVTLDAGTGCVHTAPPERQERVLQTVRGACPAGCSGRGQRLPGKQELAVAPRNPLPAY